MIFETYGMIVPDKGSCKYYEEFYSFYSLHIKQNLLINHLLNDHKSSLHILNLELKEAITNKLTEIDNILPAMGLKRTKTDRDDYFISVQNNDLLFRKKYFSNNYAKFIDFITNIQQFLLLYSSFEGSIKSYIFEKNQNNSHIEQKKVLKELFKIDSKIVQKFNSLSYKLTEDNLNTIWEYFTNIRNLYSHTNGIIDKKFIDNMNTLSSKINDLLHKNFTIEQLLYFTDNSILRTNDFLVEKLFVISEREIRFFRNFIIHIWESVYLTHYKLVKKRDLFKNKRCIYVDNNFTFKTDIIYGNEPVSPELLTTRVNNFRITGYLCPKCKADRIYLYKTLFHPNINLSVFTNDDKDKKIIVDKVFTCPQCFSFFISKVGKNLSDNNGVNILDLEEDYYFDILNRLNVLGTKLN